LDTTAQVLTRRARITANVAGPLLASVLACSSSSQHPPELGRCVPTPTVPCSSPSSPGGGSSPEGEGGVTGAGDSGPVSLRDGASCGLADTSLVNGTQGCAACIVAGTGSAVGLDCCTADSSCSTDCVQIVSCVQANCQLGDGACVATCELASPNGVQAYNDFASCLRSNCSPQCPTLTLATAGDI
jgi:hypothetical protein